MSVIGSNILAGASGQGGDYTIARSLRLRNSASAYLNRTPASATNQTTWTWSGWVKRGTLGVQQKIFFAGASGTNFASFEFISGDNFQFFAFNGSTNAYLVTTQVFRDPSAWYHIAFIADTTNATSSNRLKLFINGTQVTSFSTATYPSQNFAFPFNNTVAHTIGRDNPNASDYFDGYLTEVNFIDGQALTPSSFGANNASTGVWQPKKYAGTYGTNGFYLPFSDNASTTTLGNDFSGNSNNWTTNNISLTAGATYDSMTDVPTLTSATAANFCVMNPLVSPLSGSTYTFSNANLTTLVSVQTAYPAASVPTMSFQTSGKWYCEVTLSAQGAANTWKIGITSNPRSSGSSAFGDVSADYAWQINGNFSPTNPTFYNNGSPLGAYGSTITTNDTLMVAYDVTSGKFWLGKNGTWFNSGDPAAGTNAGLTGLSGEYWLGLSTGGTTNSTNTYQVNFGQRPFAYTPPTGFVALNTFNLPTPTIGATASTQANKYFDATLYSGNSSTQSIVNAGGFSPDLVWIKSRSDATFHVAFDVLRGTGVRLFPNDTEGDNTSQLTTSLTSFNSNGFSLGSHATTNNSGQSYVAWQWDAGGTGVSNTAGSITSTVSANTSAGFSVVTYTGTGANATVGHGLGVAPKMIIIKNRAGEYNWRVWHTTLSSTELLYLNTTDSKVTGQTTAWNSTLPTSTVFSLGSSGGVNESSSTFVAYCFSEVAGYSKFGSFVANGSTDGAFAYCGFKPKLVLWKNSSAEGNWNILDSSRSSTNVIFDLLRPNLSDAESSSTEIVDFLSNGFKVRASLTNGNTYIFMAFAEVPQKFSLAR
jgi:hypothetical protein